MRVRSALICCAALIFAGLIQNEASAGRRARPDPLPTPTTILPSRQELSNVPRPGRGGAFPVEVVRYGLTVHPGARVVRGVFGR